VTGYVARTYAPAARQMLAGGDSTSLGQGSTSLIHVLTNSTYNDWNVEIMAGINKLPGTFRVEFFLADFTDDSAEDSDGTQEILGQWMQSAPLGTNADWKTTHTDVGNAKLKRASTLGTTRNGTVSLTAGLLERVAAGELASLDADAVVPFLTQHLGVRVTGVCPSIPLHPSISRRKCKAG
jgi:tyrosinase